MLPCIVFPMQQQPGIPLQMYARVFFTRDSIRPVSDNKQMPFIDTSYTNIDQEVADSTSGFDLHYSIDSSM